MSLVRTTALVPQTYRDSDGDEQEVMTIFMVARPQYVASSYSERSVHVLDTQGNQLHRFEDALCSTWGIEFLRDTLICGSTDGSIRVYDMLNG